ncbi:uncharacterized protein LOC120338688 [Styela clava]
MSSSALPPPRNLPSWSRVSTFDRSRYPKPFLRDRIPLPPNGDATADFNTSLSNVDVQFLEKMTSNVQHHLLSQDKSIKFLQQQHSETLSKLHAELEMLKRDNKALQFKIVSTQKGISSFQNLDETIQSYSNTAPADIKTLLLQEEIKDLKQALKEASLKNNEMQEMIHKLESNKTTGLETTTDLQNAELSRRHRRKYSVSNLSTPLPLNATLNPLQIRDNISDAPRLPSKAECEFIIQQLHEINCQQLQELSRLRADRRSMTPRSSITLDSPVMKMYSSTEKESFSDTRLPRIPVRPSIRKSVKSASLTDMEASFPSLESTMTINPADRHRRQQKINTKQIRNLK